MYRPRRATFKRLITFRLVAVFAVVIALVSALFVAMDVRPSQAAPACVTSDKSVVNGRVTYKIIYSDNTAGCDWSVPAGVNGIDVAVVGGGGSSGMLLNAPGGGGGGQVLYRSNYSVSPGNSFSVSIGRGGGTTSSANSAGITGGNTTFGSVTALGGGGGGAGTFGINNNRPRMSEFGLPGGSAGGNTLCGGTTTAPLATPNTFSGWTSFGNNGGLSVGNCVMFSSNATWGGSGGGGGAMSAGTNATVVFDSATNTQLVTPGRGGRGVFLLGYCLGGGGDGITRNAATGYLNSIEGVTSSTAIAYTSRQTCLTPEGVDASSVSGSAVNVAPVADSGSGASSTTSGVTAPPVPGYFPGANGVVIISYQVPAPVITSSAFTTAPRPTITGSGVNGSTVNVTVGSAVYTRTVSSGVWSVNLQTATPNSGSFVQSSSYSVSVTQTDSNNDVSSPVSQTITVDASAPNAPTSALLATASNSGNTSDFTTNVTSPTINLTGLESGATFLVTATKSGTSVTCSGTATSTTGSCVLNGLTDGTWALTARQTDQAGNASPVLTATSIVILSSISAPLILNSSTLINSTSFSLTFTTTGSVTTTCSLDGGISSSCTSPRTFSGLSEGAHTIVVTASDVAGNTSSASYSFTVDSIAPFAPTITTTDAYQRTATPSIHFTGEGSAVFNCKIDSGSFSACTSPFVPSTLSEGAHTVTINQTDAAGNTSLSATYTFTVDTVAPGQPTISNTSTLVSTATPAMTFTGEAGASFQCLVDSGSYSSCSSPYVLPSLSEGSHTFYVRQVDLAGNVSAAKSYTFSVDSIAPVASLTPPTNVRNPGSLSFELSLSESVSAVPTTSNFSVTGTGCSVSSVSGSGTQFSVAVTGCSDAQSVSLTLNAGLTDTAGNPVASVTSSPILTDGTAPSVSITAPSSTSNSNLHSFTITLSEPATGFDVSDLTTTGTASGCLWLLSQTSSTVYTYSASGCSEGTLGVSVLSGVLTDVAGNTGPLAAISSVLVTIDHTAPTVTWTMATPTWASVSSLTPSWTTGDASGVGVVTRQVATLNSSNVCGTWSDDAVATSGYSSAVSDRSCYRWTFTTAPTDAAGNTTSSNLTSAVIMVDRSVAAPTITSGTPVANSNTYTASFTGETGATFRCSLDGASPQACTSPVSLTALVDGSHTFAVYQTDPAGNLSTAQEVTWTIDTQIQTVVLSAPSSPTNASTLSYAVVFDKSVTGVSASDFTAPGTSCSIASVSGSGRHYTVAVTGCAHGDVVTLRLAANSTTDASGNTGPSAIALASSVTIDTQAPSAPTVSHTGTVTTADTAGINILGEAGATFNCSLDGGTAVACTSPSYVLSGLSVGSHTISVTQTDLAGNISTPATATWTTQLPTQTLNPTPTISGTLEVGRTLIVAPGTFDAGTTQVFSWLRDGSPISGATASSYVLTASDLNASISVQVTSSRAGYQDLVVFSAGTAQISRGSLSLTPLPAVSGATTFGQTLTVQTGTWDSGVTLTYQWLRGGVAISGATSQTYTLGLTDVGSRISLAVTGSKTGYNSVTTTVVTAHNVAAATIPQSSTPTISGNYSNGSVLTANSGAWTSGVSLTYQWLRGSTPISGATSSTYTLTADDIDATITVRVVGSLPGHNDVTLTSDGTSAITGMAQTLTPVPTISGVVSVGQTLTADAGTWDSGVNLSYQWLRGSSLISGATSSTYTLTASDLNAQITVRVTGAKTGYSTSVRHSSNTVAVARGVLLQTPTPTISGNAQVGSTLSATVGTWDVGTNLTVQWLRDGVAIPGATSLTYVLVGQDYQSSITVAVTGAKSGYVSQTQTSTPFTGIQRAQLGSTPAPTIVGLPTVGQALTVSTAGWDSGVQFSYRWFADGTLIVGATSSTYVPVSADATLRLTVEVTGSKFGYHSSVQTSAASEEVSVIRNFSSSSVPAISGVARNGEILTVNIGTWDAGTTIAIQWMRSGLPISGATGETYQLSNQDVFETITVIVRGTQTGFNPLSRISNEIGPVSLGIQSPRTPQIVGTLQVGETLSVNPGSWQGTVRLQYQWFANGVTVDGATSRTYLLSPELLNSSVSVRVVSSRAGYLQASAQSSAVGPVVAGIQPAIDVAITGEPEVADILTLTTPQLNSAVELNIQWLRDSENIAFENDMTYLVAQEDIGHRIGATVQFTRAGYVPREVTVQSSGAVDVNASVQDMEIKGDAKIGEDLVVVKQRCESQATYTYQWLRDGIAIDGADGPTYTVTAADLGSTITAVATQFVDGEITEIAVSEAYAIDASTGPAPTGAESQTGSTLSFWESISQFFGVIWTFLTGWIIPATTAKPC